MFEPGKLYTNLFQFENDLNKFFTEKNIDYQVLDYVGGQTGKRLVYLCPKDPVEVEEKEDKPVKPMTPKEQADKLRNNPKNPKRVKSGKYT